MRSVVQIYPGPPLAASGKRAGGYPDLSRCGATFDGMAAFELRASNRSAGATSPVRRTGRLEGAVAQSGERLLCKQEVVGSNPIGSTISGGRAGEAVFVSE